jgi:hypothetical protein
MRAVAVVVVALLATSVPAAFAQGGGQVEKPKETATAADPITGDWEGSVAMADGNIAFFMKLKLDKDKVTGEIGSDQGTSQLTGTWAEAKLTLSFTYVNGEPISMTGAFKEEQLGGDITIGSGQMVTVWVAKKKVQG